MQEFPRARAAIKYLVADGRYHYLETGSLVSIQENVSDIVIPSEEDHVKMYPFDFEEFLWATGREALVDVISSHLLDKESMGAAHRKANVGESVILHPGDLSTANGKLRLPLYMTPWIDWR